MANRLKIVRQGLRERLEKLGTPGNWSHVTNQTGMFFYSGLSCKEYKSVSSQLVLIPNHLKPTHNLDLYFVKILLSNIIG